MDATTQQAVDFRTAFRGQFTGILHWQQLDELWRVIRQSGDNQWYIYAVGETVPDHPVTSAELKTFVEEIDQLLHDEHEEDYCGIVYTDSKQHPTFVKIFDPNNLGVVCGFSNNPPLPGWILSTKKPEQLEDMRVLPGNRKRWWKRLWAN